jgi:putative phosphonate metabolism protein
MIPQPSLAPIVTADVRYALYLVPPRDCVLWAQACRWLGRNPETGVLSAQPAVPGYAPQRVRQLTRSPRQYGFHATLKAPFRLVHGVDEPQLMAEVARLVGSLPAIAMPALQVDRLGGFVALRPAGVAAQLMALEQRCVTGLDALRAPLEADERARRHAAGLTPRQKDLLEQWGYPFVLDEYRFHMTLTERLDNADTAYLLPWLQSWLGPALGADASGADLAVFLQPHLGADFVLRRRFPLLRS